MDSMPPWPVVQSLLLTVVLPGFAVGAGLLAGVCIATRSESSRLIGGALALAGGLALGNWARGLLPWWSLELGWPSLFPATLAAIGGGVVAELASSAQGWRRGLGLRFVAVAGCAFWLAPSGTPRAHLGFFVLLFAASALNWEVFRRGEVQGFGRVTLLALAIPWGIAAATVLIHAHSARFCDLAVLQTSTLAGVGIIAARWRLDVTALFVGPAIFFPALMLGGAANTFSEVPGASFILIALAPCALWCLRLRVFRRLSDRSRAATAVVAVLVFCVVAVVLAMRAETLDFGSLSHRSVTEYA